MGWQERLLFLARAVQYFNKTPSKSPTLLFISSFFVLSIEREIHDLQIFCCILSITIFVYAMVGKHIHWKQLRLIHYLPPCQAQCHKGVISSMALQQKLAWKLMDLFSVTIDAVNDWVVHVEKLFESSAVVECLFAWSKHGKRNFIFGTFMCVVWRL